MPIQRDNLQSSKMIVLDAAAKWREFLLHHAEDAEHDEDFESARIFRGNALRIHKAIQEESK